MKTTNNIINKAAKKIVNNMVKKELDGWPPVSPFGFYQPVRPQKRDSRKWEDTPVQKGSRNA